MAKFSIKNALAYGFSAYTQHFMLLVAVGLTLGAGQWGMSALPKMVADHFGVKAQAVAGVSSKKMGPKAAMARDAMSKPPMQVGAQGSKTVEVHHQLRETGKTIHQVIAHKAYMYMDNDPGQLFMVFLVWLALFCLLVFLQMGIIRVALDLVDKNTSSYAQLFSQRSQFFRFLGVLIVFALLWLVIFLGSILAGVVVGGLLAIPLVYIFSDAGAMISGFIGFVAGFVVCIKFMMRYFFCTYCLIDKKMGVHKAFSCTYEITKGSVLRLMVLGFIFMIPTVFLVGGTVHLNVHIGKMIAHDSYHVGIISKLIGGIYGMWVVLCSAHVYRKLSRG